MQFNILIHSHRIVIMFKIFCSLCSRVTKQWVGAVCLAIMSWLNSWLKIQYLDFIKKPICTNFKQNVSGCCVFCPPHTTGCLWLCCTSSVFLLFFWTVVIFSVACHYPLLFCVFGESVFKLLFCLIFLTLMHYVIKLFLRMLFW